MTVYTPCEEKIKIFGEIPDAKTATTTAIVTVK